MSFMSKSLRSLPKNEWPWAIRSGRSPKMSEHERIAQVANQKWANERIACFFEQIAYLLIFSQKTSDLLRKPMSEFPALSCSYLFGFSAEIQIFLTPLSCIGLHIWIMKDKNLDHENHTPVICSISHSFSLSCETISLETRLKMRKEKAVCDIPFAFPGGGWREN